MLDKIRILPYYTVLTKKKIYVWFYDDFGDVLLFKDPGGRKVPDPAPHCTG